MSRSGAELIPNLGAEEDRDWRRALASPAVAAAARLWRLLFADSARLVGLPEGVGPGDWPPALGEPAQAPVFPWLENEGGRVAWLSTSALLEEHGSACGTEPGAVARVHDKAFAQRFAEREGYVPRCLRDCIAIVEADVLREPEAIGARLEALLASWPDWAREHFVLKPRFGSSGRGRVAGRRGQADTPEIRGSLGRLAACGGAMLEPWLTRTADLSAQLYVPSDAAEGVVLLGTLEQLLTPSGLYRGHRGQMDSRGRVFSGHPREEALREAAAALALEARREGYVGPCGVDAFEFRRPDSAQETTGERAFRPIVELNARYTLGLIVLGLARRALPSVKRVLDLQPGARVHFVFALASPVEAWSELASRDVAGVHRIPLGAPDAKACPALLFARDAAVVDDLLGDR